MPRFALRLEYDGAPFSGWQRQRDHPSVQAVVEDALSRIDPAHPGIGAAGRTDAGVHAMGQVAHCDLSRDWSPFKLAGALNYHMKPHPVAVVAAARVPDDFHARFSARSRSYRYHITCRRAPLVHRAGQSWRVPFDLDIATMQAGADRLLGTHDLTTFRATGCQAKSPVKTVDSIRISAQDTGAGREIAVDVVARSFLHNQVRSFVGTLERVGAGAWTPQDVTAALQARDRAACGPVAPPDGLYLMAVGYDFDPFAGVAP